MIYIWGLALLHVNTGDTQGEIHGLLNGERTILQQQQQQVVFPLIL